VAGRMRVAERPGLGVEPLRSELGEPVLEIA
jgi:hypothetical protein